ncbi:MULTISPECIES: hypothetical protein [Bacillaceae]|uniref:Uncharacterized protein n=2 Tax=Bacillaceae TaxID=186817 RepID=A0ABX2ZRF7_9BACI|nr:MULTISPECIES: hypothetical protein [Bacillaceae]ODG91059.1 hypothetical protein BED47_08505 [Gottfriedia luciferensis]SFC81654.1 hypothetical protein SAMN02799633_01800 [Bacillus sp. UNCCL81]
MQLSSRISIPNYVTKRFFVLYSVPFLISVLLIFLTDPLKVVDLFYQTLYLSIFYIGLPIGVVFLPYYGYFYLLQKYFKVTYVITVTALITTIIALILVFIVIQKTYKSFETRSYFTKETTSQLSKKSNELFEKETGVKGKINKLKMISRYNDADNGDFTLTRKRYYDIEVVSKNPSDLQKIPRSYKFISVNGKWILKTKNEKWFLN